MLLPAAAAPACGCGAMIPADGSGGQRVDEWSIVEFDGRRETIAMRLESSRAFDQAALIMPLPAKAEFELGDDAEFTEMAERTKPRREKKTRHTFLFGGRGSSEDGATGAGGVEVVDAQDLGPLRVVTLRGDDASAVGRYLDDQGFRTPAGLEDLAQRYLDEGWVLAAVRLRGERGSEIQKLQPLVMSFPSERVVYPLRMSQLASSPTSARVDVIAPEPLAVSGRGWVNRDLKEAPSRATGRIFGGPMPDGRYLSSFQFAISPGSVEDPQFDPTARKDLRQVIYEYEDKDVTGLVFGILFGALLLGALLVVLFVRRRKRSR